MPALDSTQFLKSVQTLKDFPPILFLIGDEDALLSDCLKGFQSAFVKRFGDAMLDFNMETLYGEKEEASKILDACATLPLGSERRLVILNQAEKLAASAQDELEAYFSSPNPSTSLVCLWNGKPSQAVLSKGLPALAGASGTMVKCWRMSFEDKRAEWIRSQFTEQGREITREASFLLSGEGGESLRELKSEIEKLILFIGDRKRIELGDVRQTMSFLRNQLVWNFTDHLEAGRIKPAGLAMEQCLEQGEAPVMLLNLMARSARKMVAGRGGSSSRAVQLKLFDQLKETDLALKSGHGLESGVFERLLPAYAALAR